MLEIETPRFTSYQEEYTESLHLHLVIPKSWLQDNLDAKEQIIEIIAKSFGVKIKVENAR